MFNIAFSKLVTLMLCPLLLLSLIILIKVIILVFLMYQYMLNHENDAHYRF